MSLTVSTFIVVDYGTTLTSIKIPKDLFSSKNKTFRNTTKHKTQRDLIAFHVNHLQNIDDSYRHTAKTGRKQRTNDTNPI